ncbi:MAG TPA: glycoside hydrolase family 2 TIM barrel-domain containing protein, partial [Fimbriimonadaceae bacterium]|nr:glycoside hydrolase family 2 TIM barrel-domain containing protein [Fimbriimonadaceae bacterium]
MLAIAAIAAVSVQSPRLKIDLDQNWEFARLPPAPGRWSFPDAAPTSSWRIVSVDSQETEREDGRAQNAIDGDANTIWHTQWGSRQPGFPHEITISLGSEVEAVGVRLLPRQVGPHNGRPKDFDLFLSEDGKAWGEAAFTGHAPDSQSLFEARFPAHRGRYMRILFENGQSKEPFLALSEIGLIRSLDTKARRDWASQYNIATVDLGDARFDLHDATLERVKNAEMAEIGKWQPATLPHSPWIRPLGTSEIWQGVAYYRRKLDLTPEMRGRRVVLTIEGAMQLSDLWLNGVHVAVRRGGYLPLVVDLTGKLKVHNEILVRVDNSDNPLIPPGKPQQELDFMYGCGIYRNAYLTVTGPVAITDPMLENLPRSGGIYVTYPLVGPGRSIVRVYSHVRNSSEHPVWIVVEQHLLDREGLSVASASVPLRLGPGEAKQVAQDLEVRKANLWSPDSPYRYRLETSLDSGDARLDEVATTVGIRSVEVSRARGFVLNGKPIRLVGTNRHQDYPWIGIALSDRAQMRDAILIKRAGHNIVRLSHYPQSPAFMDACDRLGIMTIPCIPGWQFMNHDPRFRERVLQDIRELIRRDRNHPSAVFWEASLNETYPPNDVARQWNRAAKDESLDGRISTAGDALTGAPWDIAYNQWKDADMSRPQDAAPDRPGYIREYGDYEFGGAQSSSRVRFADGPAALLQEAWNEVWSLNRYRPQYPWTMGAGTWVMFDHNVPWEFRISACGLADLFRREKPSFWFFESQEAKKPYLRIFRAGAKVVAFTNCAQVALTARGKLFGRKSQERGRSTAYALAKPFDGSNTEHLAEPPIVFDHVPEGSLTAVGYAGGRRVARDEAPVPGVPYRLKLWIDDEGVRLKADGADAVFVRAAVVDVRGVVVPSATGRVHFSVSGAGSLAGE